MALLLLILAFPFEIEAQRVSEEELNNQKVFIEASREKILGNYENAIVLYKEVLKTDKKNHAAAYELARLYDILDKNDKALSSIKMAIALDKTNEWYRSFLADVYQKGKKDGEAAKVFEELVEDYSNNEYYYYKWAYYLVRSQKAAKAINVYDQIEKRFGVSEDVISKKHNLYLGLGKQSKATDELLKLTKAFPYNVEYKHMLAGHYNRIGEEEKGKKVYREILQLDPQDASANMALLNSRKGGNNDIAYLTSLQPIFKNEAMDIDLKIKEMIPFIKKVAATNDKELADAAIELTQILEEVHPEEAKTFSVYGDLLNHTGRPQQALEKYMKTLKLDNTVFTVWEQVMYLNYELKDFDALLKNSDEALDLFPNKVKAYYLNGIANNEKGNYDDAVNVFEQALMMSTENPKIQFDIYGRLGEVYHNLKKYDKSKKSFEKGLKINPRAYTLLDSYSYHLALRGDNLDKAKEMSALANELQPNEPTIQDTYGWILYKMKEYKAAKEWLEKALQNGGDEMPTILEHFGDILYHMDEKEEALLYWQKALDKGSASELLEKKIADKKLYE